MQEANKRKLKIDFGDRNRLHTAIESTIRREGIPSDLFGKDLIRGTIIGLIEHPDYSMDVAIEKAAEHCRIIGNRISVKRAVYEMTECYLASWDAAELLPESSESNIYELDRIIEMWYGKKDSERAYQKAMTFVTEVTKGLIYEIQKAFCYTVTLDSIEKRGLNLRELAVDILKNMVFKKLMADESTMECMYEYAYRKSVWGDEKDIKKIMNVVDGYCESIIPDDCKNVYEYACRIADEIYSCKETSPS